MFDLYTIVVYEISDTVSCDSPKQTFTNGYKLLARSYNYILPNLFKDKYVTVIMPTLMEILLI